jgi:hypothetical protein
MDENLNPFFNDLDQLNHLNQKPHQIQLYQKTKNISYQKPYPDHSLMIKQTQNQTPNKQPTREEQQQEFFRCCCSSRDTISTHKKTTQTKPPNAAKTFYTKQKIFQNIIHQDLYRQPH